MPFGRPGASHRLWLARPSRPVVHRCSADFPVASLRHARAPRDDGTLRPGLVDSMQHTNMDQGSPPPRPKRPPRQKKRRKRKKVDLRLTAPTAVLQGSPPGRGVFRMSLRASQVGKPRRQLSTSGPESDIAAGALTLLFTQPTKQCNPQTKPAWGPSSTGRVEVFQLPQTLHPPGLPSKTAIASPGRYGYRARKRDSGFHALTNAGRGCLGRLPSSRCGDHQNISLSSK